MNPPDSQQCIIFQIEKTMSLQEADKDCMVRIMKYVVADDHLYIVMQHSPFSLRQLCESQSIVKDSVTQ